MPNVNFLAILIAAIVGTIIGVIWYGPMFGRVWKKLTGASDEDVELGKSETIKNYALAFGGQLLTAYALASIIVFTFQYFSGFSYELIIWIWLGLVVPLLLNRVLWQGESWKLLILDSGYYLAQLLVMGAILSLLP